MFVSRGCSLLFFLFVHNVHQEALAQVSGGDLAVSPLPTTTPSAPTTPAPPLSRAALFSSPGDTLILNDASKGRSLPSPIGIISSLLQPIILALVFQQLRQQQQKQQEQQPSTQPQQQLPQLSQLLQLQLIQQQLVQQQLIRQQLLRQQLGLSQSSRAQGTTQNGGSRGSFLGGGRPSFRAGQGFGLGSPFGFESSFLSRSIENDEQDLSNLDLASLLQIPSVSRTSQTRFKKSSAVGGELKKRSGPVTIQRSKTNNNVLDPLKKSANNVHPRLNLSSQFLDSTTSLNGGRGYNSKSSSTENHIRFPFIRELTEAPTSFSQTPLFHNRDLSTSHYPFQRSLIIGRDNDQTKGNSEKKTSDPTILDHSLTTFYRNLPLTKQVQESIRQFLKPGTANVVEFLDSQAPHKADFSKPQTANGIGFTESSGQKTEIETPDEAAVSFDGTAHLLAALLFANHDDLTKVEEKTFSSRQGEDVTRKFRFPDE